MNSSNLRSVEVRIESIRVEVIALEDHGAFVDIEGIKSLESARLFVLAHLDHEKMMELFARIAAENHDLGRREQREVIRRMLEIRD